MENYPLYGEAHAALSRNREERHKKYQPFKRRGTAFFFTLNVEEFLHLCTARINGNQSLFSSDFYVKWAVFSLNVLRYFTAECHGGKEENKVHAVK